MSSSDLKCVLKFVKQNSSLDLPDIEILHNTGKKTIGRSLETQIESPNVSREHGKHLHSIVLCFLTKCFYYFSCFESEFRRTLPVN